MIFRFSSTVDLDGKVPKPKELIAFLIGHPELISDEDSKNALKLMDGFQFKAQYTSNGFRIQSRQFALRKEMRTVDQHAHYVQMLLERGMIVRSLVNTSKFLLNDTAIVLKVAPGELHGLNVLVHFPFLYNPVWLRYKQIEIVDYPSTDHDTSKVTIGKQVKFKKDSLSDDCQDLKNEVGVVVAIKKWEAIVHTDLATLPVELDDLELLDSNPNVESYVDAETYWDGKLKKSYMDAKEDEDENEDGDDCVVATTIKDYEHLEKNKYPSILGIPEPFHVFVWGLNDQQQIIAQCISTKESRPVFANFWSVLRPIHMAGGNKSTYALSRDGFLFVAGENVDSRLGLDHRRKVNKPQRLQLIEDYCVKVASSLNGDHTLVLTRTGDVFSWGANEHGQLGHGDRVSLKRPRRIWALKGIRIVDIAVGSKHSACVTAQGEVFTWGLGDRGRLGHGDFETHLKPKRIDSLIEQKVVQVVCGSLGAHTMCLTSLGRILAWGDGNYGKLGIGGNDNYNVPTDLNQSGMVQIAAGAKFSMALRGDGQVSSWGRGGESPATTSGLG